MRRKPGRQKSDLQPYTDEVDEKIIFLQKKLRKMRQGLPVSEVVQDEMEEVCKRLPHMKGVYEGLTRRSYAKMLRNRVSALKSRIKKKSEERELKMLRTMARRLFLLQRFSLMPPREFELLKIENDEEFEAIIGFLTSKRDKTTFADRNASKKDLFPSLDHFLPSHKRPHLLTSGGQRMRRRSFTVEEIEQLKINKRAKRARRAAED